MDLWATDVSASQTTVAEWDGYADPIPTLFWVCQLGPDCKIYIEGGDTRYYHVIHNPDGAGMACNVEQRGLVLPTPNGASMPVFPNYRLGPLDNPGVPCTATVSVNPGPEVEPGQVRLFPNPASDELTIEYRFADVMNRQFLLYNAYGQMVIEISLPAGGGKVNIPVGKMASGVYWYVSPGTDAIVLCGKIIINH
ncbi:MAG: T9SS type A sorting domain-containing protein [Saprospiraceae bacterium]|nr:T9SS type A sorting domain-containing protein [Saprospiraceae bacterium]